jgi:DNA-binding CsgD family transcriptional regulator/tetratricopeptide (TPR) repeat protein
MRVPDFSHSLGFRVSDVRPATILSASIEGISLSRNVTYAAQIYSRDVGAPPTDDLVGRDAELSVARQLIYAVRRGAAASLLVEGEAGIGKTRLVQRIVEESRNVGASVLAGGAHPLERNRPFGVLVDALDLRTRSTDPRRARIGRLIVGEGDKTVGAARPLDARLVVVDAIIELLETLGSDRPIVLVLEDLHWVDDSTPGAIRAIVHDLGHVALLLVATLRPTPRSPDLDVLLDECVAIGTRVIQLRSLKSADVDALVRRRLGAAPGALLSSIVAKAGGNPLWLVELIRSLEAEGWLERDGDVVEAVADELPSTLRDLVLRRLRYLPVGTLNVLQLASLLGEAVSVRDLAVVARRSEPELIADLSEAFRGRLLDERADAVVFRHQVVQQAIYEDVPMPARRAMHRHAAGALARSGADPATVASHVLLGADRGDLQAVRWLRDASMAAAASAPSVAVKLLRRAIELLPAGHTDADLVSAELAEALQRSGQVAEASAVAESILARSHRADVDIPLRLTLVSALSLQNRPIALVKRAESALQAPGLRIEDQALVLTQASYGRTFSGDFVGGEATARRALAIAERAASVAMTVWSLSALTPAVKTQGRYGEALAITRRAVALAFDPLNDEARLRHPHFFLAMALADSDRFKEAKDAYARVISESEELGSGWLLPDMLMLAGECRFLTGDWDDAAAEFEPGLLLAAQHGQRISINQTRAYQAVIATARADLTAAKSTLSIVADQLSTDAPWYGAEMVGFAAAAIAEAAGDQSRAFQTLWRFWLYDIEREIRYYHRYFGPSLVRLGLALGRVDLADDVVGVVEGGAALAPEVPSVMSAALRCRGLLERDPERLLHATELARQGGRALDHGAACEDAAAVLVGAGQPEDAKRLLVETQSRYNEMGATAWSARVAAALRRLGVHQGVRGGRRRPETGWESLTSSERAVSKFVAQGLTNREIARRLHISPHTVNTHMRHIFQKLSVRTRAELAAMIAARHSDNKLTHSSDVSRGGGRTS